MSMQNWLAETDTFLAMTRREILEGKGKISHAEAIVKANKKEKSKKDKITHRGLIVSFGNGAIYIGLIFLVFHKTVRICIESFQNGTVDLLGCIVFFLLSIPVLIFFILDF